METIPHCPECKSSYVYIDGGLYICPECSHEWSVDKRAQADFVVKDANGNILKDGDTVTIIKDLKVKGSREGIKIGTKIKNIRLTESSDDHNIDCRVPGIGAIRLRQIFVKRIQGLQK